VKASVPTGATIIALFADGVRQPIARGSDAAAMTLKTGERETTIRRTDPPSPPAGAIGAPPQTHEETRRVLIPKGGISVVFPSQVRLGAALTQARPQRG
jgi:hypothetical protein